MKWNIWTGAAWEDWAWDSSREGGIGGSETAAVMVSRELTKLGHEVTVYGQFKDGTEGKHEGVEYVHFKRVTDVGQVSGDVFVSSRDVGALMIQPKYRACAVWVHDINLGHDTYDRLDKYDAIMCLSNWSAKTIEAYYPHVRKKRLFITRNGLDLSRFSPEKPVEEVLRNKPWPPRFVFSSSPDRGLDKLLDMWPKIREIAPGAELHVYYGFKTWELMAKGNTAAVNRVNWFKERLRRSRDAGVTFHGRVGQEELAAAHMNATLWLYPTDFKETSCITAMEAMAAGTVPVCTGLAALNETVGKYGVLVKPYNMEPRYATEFLGAVKALLVETPELRLQMAKEARKHALASLSWEGVARQWTSHFEQVIAEKESAREVRNG